MFDFPHLKFDHGEDIDMLRDTVARFVADQITPRAAEIDATNTFPDDIWRKLGDLGLLGITAPKDVGGTGLGLSISKAIVERLGGTAARPLLNSVDASARVRDLLAERSSGYARFASVDTEGRSPDQVADAVMLLLGL